ncbi:MAG: fumarylacetoacetate hydrolase family protein [Hyphomicrobiaceae bacterium]
MTFNPSNAAAFIVDAHKLRAPYQNLPEDIAPKTIAEAYAAQEALIPLWSASKGKVAGLKIATTTKIMQQLMGIDHPCGGLIFERTIHTSPATIKKRDFLNVVAECELSVRLGQDLPPKATPYTRDDVLKAIAAVMPAFELIEDRLAVYKESRALSLIADNAWNGGIVFGAPVAPPKTVAAFDGIEGILSIDGKNQHSGKTDDPLGALAWVANLAIERGRPMTAGMVVITGSVIPTLPIPPGQTFEFTLAGLGSVRMTGAD